MLIGLKETISTNLDQGVKENKSRDKGIKAVKIKYGILKAI